ncbi:MAG: DNA topoisomerase IV subunit A, partial [Rubricoccaceae bacterium]|nr:DNA topoisomerase IV subunit A [Rubricoccaceae bacterium]
MKVVETIPLHETTRERYLNYALSVITSRALPDIRDGLKPVQRRILYAMYTNLRLLPDTRYRKSATVVGEVMGKYHPHGDTAIYDAMVRMAQDFSLRSPLVDGQGNFGSIDGDSPAAMRYTEARLQELGAELLSEIRKDTVHFRPNYDGTLFEPVVLPAPFPNLLVNGASGIAVGMATNIPPHNLGEIIDACIHLIGAPNARFDTLMKYVQGPDFPTGGRILNTEEEIRAIYESGEGAIDVRGEYESEGKSRIVITSIPYGMAKSDLIEKIADHIRQGKVPQLVDIRDESTEDVRIVLEVKRGSDADAAMAYLFKHTPLQTRFHVNMTCLVPTHNPEVAAPRKVDLRLALTTFLEFRMETVVRRLRYDLEQLEKRIHILRGFAIIFDALDEAIKIIRASNDKADASQRLRHRFGIDEIQADAILEIKLYRLAKMEIDAILAELEEKERLAKELRELLDDDDARWKVVRDELRDLRDRYADQRRTAIEGPDDVLEYSAEDYIVKEDVYAIVTRDGWVKRQKSYADLESIRVREGDAVGWALATSTRATVCFFTSAGKAYTLLADELPSTTGYGDPIQKIFDFSDREKVVGVIALDERVLPRPLPVAENPDLFSGDGAPAEGAFAGPFVVAISSDGLAVRMTLEGFSEPSTRKGRTYMRTRKGQKIVAASLARGNENVCLASKEGRALIFPVGQISLVKSAAKGVIAMRLQDSDDAMLGMAITTAARDGLEVETSRGRTEIVRTTKFEVQNRGGKGRTIISRGTLKSVNPEPVEVHLAGNGNG